jgi:hypothetical protein
MLLSVFSHCSFRINSKQTEWFEPDRISQLLMPNSIRLTSLQPGNIRLLKRLAADKHSSLLRPNVIDEEKSLMKLDTWLWPPRCFGLAPRNSAEKSWPGRRRLPDSGNRGDLPDLRLAAASEN